MTDVTVAIPIRDGGRLLAGVLDALAGQTVDHELLVCDSGSVDGSPDLARSRGARVLRIAPQEFNHGRTRNLLVSEARGAHVALLTQDAEPADERWLEQLLSGFELAPDVGIVYGPYRPREDASAPVRIELERWFESLSPDGGPQVERLSEPDGQLPVTALMGRLGFFTDANACVARAAWQRVPFREIPYAEDRVLAIDMLRAGYAKIFMPRAAVVHSHDYTTGEHLRRCFDEWRGLREVYGWCEPVDPRRLAGSLRGELGSARRRLIASGAPARRRRATLIALSRHHIVRMAGALLGSRAGALPAWLRHRLSLEGRGGFSPVDFEALGSRGADASPDSGPR
jgi:glycosyltransferase involved in cell wall biosynthesis